MTNTAKTPVERMSPAPNAERIERLKRLFPEIECEGKIDFDTLRELLNGAVDDRPERYSFSWAGKRDAIRLLAAPSRATLMPDRDAALEFDATQNLFIEGDNLEALKLLYKSYFGGVKMIYIDPPYNTGNDFVYPDNYRDPLDTYLQLTGQRDAEGNLLISNTDTGGRYHSAWLSMMYPRLFLARQLLREDGVIFISVDDHEVHNLRLLMNEIFGEENFVATVIWQKVYAPKSSARHFSEDHDFVIIYARNGQNWNPSLLPRTDAQDKIYKNPDSDPRGRWRPNNLAARNYYSKGTYQIKCPGGRVINGPPRGSYWRISEEKLWEMDADGRIWWGEDGNNVPAPKIYLSEVKEGRVPQTFWSYKDVGHTQEAKRELLSLVGFPDSESVFETPKPVRLIRRTLQIGTHADEDDIVLDFFAGSATTAQAVLQLNREDGGNRRFIMVQLPEPLGKPIQLDNGAELRTIADIGKERIRRVVDKMQSDREGELDLSDRETPEDLGFRVYKLAESNFRQWDESQSSAFTRQSAQASASGSGEASGSAENAATPANPEATGNTPDGSALVNQMELFTDPLVDGWKPEDVIAEMTIREGLSLTSTIEQAAEVVEATVYRVNDPAKAQSFAICLDDKLRLESLAPLDLTRDDLFICRDIALDDETAANLALQCRLKVI